MDANLAKNCLDMDLHGGLGDIHFSRDGLVRGAFNKAEQYQPLSRRKLWRRVVNFCHKNRLLVVLVRAVVAQLTLFGAEHIRKKCRWQDCLAHHHQFQRPDEYIAGHDVDEAAVGTRAKR